MEINNIIDLIKWKQIIAVRCLEQAVTRLEWSIIIHPVHFSLLLIILAILITESYRTIEGQGLVLTGVTNICLDNFTSHCK